MGSVPSRARRLESAISICLLVIIVLIGIRVLLKQSNYDMGRFGTDPVAARVVEPRTAKVAGESEPALGSLVPHGFRTLSESEVYGPENLYEKINGKAPFYIESGFVKLLTQRFVSKDDEDLWMELFVYDMATARNAFSVCSVQRRMDAAVISLSPASFGYKTSNALYFVHGRYYIELLGSSESAELLQAMGQVAENISSNLLVGKDVKIPELALFPEENLVLGSIRLYLANAFGFEGLTDTFAAQYSLDNEVIRDPKRKKMRLGTLTAFFSRRSTSKDAQVTAESYCNFLIENGAVAKMTGNEALKNVQGKVLDFYGTTEIVFAIGPFVAGIHEAEDQRSAEKLAEMLIIKLNCVENNE